MVCRASVLAGLLVLSIGVVIALSFKAFPVMDDGYALEHIRSFSGFRECFGKDSYGFLRPVKNMLFWTLTRLPGSISLNAHFILAFLCAVSVLFVYLWLREWYDSALWPLAGVLMWALAPTLVSAYSWFSCANILVAVVFSMASLISWERACSGFEAGRRSAGVLWMGVCLLSFTAAFFSYEVAAVLPVLAWLQDRMRGRPMAAEKARAFSYLALVVCLAGMLAVRFSATGTIRPGNPGFAAVSDRYLMASGAYFLMNHLAWWMIPFGRQEVLGTFVLGSTAGAMLIGLSWLGMLSIVCIGAVLTWRGHRTGAGLLWAVCCLVPMCNFIPLRTGPFADYYLCLASVGLVLVLVEVLRICAVGFAKKGWMQAGCKVLFGAVVLWRLMSAVEAGFWASAWSDPSRLYMVSMKARPHAFRAAGCLARYYLIRGDLNQAVSLAHICRDEAPWSSVPCSILGDAANKRGDHGEAAAWYRSAVSNNTADAYSHYALAFTLETWLEDSGEAINHYAMALEGSLQHAYRETAMLNRGRLLGMNGRTAEAISVLEMAVSKFPESADIHYNLAVAYRQAGLTSEAERFYVRSIFLKQDSSR